MRSQPDDSKGGLPERKDGQPEDCCDARDNKLALWLADFALAIGCFAVITAAGQLPLTGPRLFQAISSVRIGTTAKRAAAQRETRGTDSVAKSAGQDAAAPNPHASTIVTLN
jgi:hypothetical protein